MKATIQKTNNKIFNYKFKCPIDKRWTYFNLNDKVCFGACERFMGTIENVVPAKIDIDKMVVVSII